MFGMTRIFSRPSVAANSVPEVTAAGDEMELMRGGVGGSSR
jgi:hypothetical protein